MWPSHYDGKKKRKQSKQRKHIINSGMEVKSGLGQSKRWGTALGVLKAKSYACMQYAALA